MDKVAPSSVGLCQYGSVEPGCPTHRSSSSSRHPQPFPFPFFPTPKPSGAGTLDPLIWRWHPVRTLRRRLPPLLSLTPSGMHLGSCPWFLLEVRDEAHRPGVIEDRQQGERFYKCPLLEHVSDSSSVDLQFCLQWWFEIWNSAFAD